MAHRSYSLTQYFQRIAEARTPQLTFRGTSPADWQKWRSQFAPKVRELCGEWPQPVPLEAEVVYRVEEGDFFREKVVYDTEQHWSVPAYVLIPTDRRRATEGRLPAILCLHGHGPYGKDAVAGVVDPNRPELAAHITSLDYDYGAQVAREGYLTISPDSRNFGECADLPERGGEVNCNWHSLASALPLGRRAVWKGPTRRCAREAIGRFRRRRRCRSAARRRESRGASSSAQRQEE